MISLAGFGFYVMESSAVLVFKIPAWKTGNRFVGYFNDFETHEHEPCGDSGYLILCNSMYFTEGKAVALKGETTYEKTEKGWRVTEFKIRGAKLIK